MQALYLFILSVIQTAASLFLKHPQPRGVALHSPPSETWIFLDTLFQAAHHLPPPLQIIFDDNIHVTSEKKAISSFHGTLAGSMIDVIETRGRDGTMPVTFT